MAGTGSDAADNSRFLSPEPLSSTVARERKNVCKANSDEGTAVENTPERAHGNDLPRQRELKFRNRGHHPEKCMQIVAAYGVLPRFSAQEGVVFPRKLPQSLPTLPEPVRRLPGRPVKREYPVHFEKTELLPEKFQQLPIPVKSDAAVDHLFRERECPPGVQIAEQIMEIPGEMAGELLFPRCRASAADAGLRIGVRVEIVEVVISPCGSHHAGQKTDGVETGSFVGFVPRISFPVEGVEKLPGSLS